MVHHFYINPIAETENTEKCRADAEYKLVSKIKFCV